MQNPFADLIPGAQTSPMFQSRPVYRQRPPEPAPRHSDQAEKDRIEATRAGEQLGEDRATRADRIAKAKAERIAAENAAKRGDPEEAKARDANRKQLGDLRGVMRQYNRVAELYRNDLRGRNIGSIAEYLPTPKMQRFEAQAKALAVQLKPLIRAPGEGPWTDADQAMLDSLVPTRFTSDEDNEERLEGIKRLFDTRVEKYGGKAKRVPVTQPKLPDGWSIEEE